MSKLLKNNLWISLAEAAEPLGAILGRKTMTSDDVLDLFTDKRITASARIKSTPLLVWPLVKLTGQDAEQFKQDERRTETYRGKSFQIKGEFWVPNREDADSMTILQGGRVLDLPLSPDTRNFLQRLQDNPVPPGKRLRLPRGTLTQIPETGQYFVTVEILEAPDVFCEIVIRTEVILEFERQLKALETKPLALPVVADSAPDGVSWTLVKPQRFQGYSKPLYDLLGAAHAAGRPCPTARDVLDAWKIKLPLEVAGFMGDGLQFFDAKGNTKPADLKAISKVIGRMTRQVPN